MKPINNITFSKFSFIFRYMMSVGSIIALIALKWHIFLTYNNNIQNLYRTIVRDYIK